MKVRIRYREVRPSVLKSVQILVSQKTNAQYSITLDINKMFFEIRNLNSRKIVKRGGEKITNLLCLKRAAKREITRLGVVFESEIRIVNTKDVVNE